MNGILTTHILPISLFIIMLGMGLSLVVDDFKRVLVYPQAVTIGLIGQLILLPLVGYLLTQIFTMSPELAVGIMLLAACPGGVTSNLIAHLAKGDTALSITLTAIASIVTVVTIPFIISFSLTHFIGDSQAFDLPIKKTMLTLFLITLLPVAIGMLIRAKAPDFALRQESKVNVFATFVFVSLFFLIVYTERHNLLEAIKLTGPACLMLNILMMCIGFGLATFFGLDERQNRTLTVEIGVQNTTLAFVIVSSILINPTMALPAAIYSLFMYATTGSLILLGRKRNRKQGAV